MAKCPCCWAWAAAAAAAAANRAALDGPALYAAAAAAAAADEAKAGGARGMGGMPPIMIAWAPYVLVSFSKADLTLECMISKALIMFSRSPLTVITRSTFMDMSLMLETVTDVSVSFLIVFMILPCLPMIRPM